MQFAESISGDLIAGRLIDRRETQEILEALTHDDVIVLHGSPGQGKSGVLYGLTKELESRDITHLPLRLDRQEPQKTTRQYGADYGLPESPVMCLDATAGDRPFVLILDQLDAIRWTSRHSLGALEVCKELVREIRGLRANGKQASVVLACRTYDMQNDPDIKNWLRSEKQKDGLLFEIAVGPLSAEAVGTVVTTLGQNPKTMSQRQRDILQSPQHLAVWVRITQERGPFDFQNRVQLMREYWDGRMREMERHDVSGHEANNVLTTVVDYIEREGRMNAPRSLVADPTTLVPRSVPAGCSEKATDKSHSATRATLTTTLPAVSFARFMTVVGTSVLGSARVNGSCFFAGSSCAKRCGFSVRNRLTDSSTGLGTSFRRACAIPPQAPVLGGHRAIAGSPGRSPCVSQGTGCRGEMEGACNWDGLLLARSFRQDVD